MANTGALYVNLNDEEEKLGVILDSLAHYAWTCYHCRGSEITVEKYEQDVEKYIEKLKDLIQEYKKEVDSATESDSDR